jgi:hypothetical protein
MSDRGYTSPNVKSLPREEATQSQETTTPEDTPAPNARVINLAISSALYNASFTYDAETKTYLRSEGGSAHIDEDSKKQIAPAVIVVPILTKGIDPDGSHTAYTTRGSGKVFVFQKGGVTEGTWTKSARSDQWTLKDANGDVILLTPGQTWFTILDKAASVSYSP